MQFLTMLIILTVSFATYLAGVHVLPSAAKFVPEILSLVVAAYIVLAGPRQRFRLIPAGYWLIFIAISLVILCGAFINAPAPGPLMGGIRFYLRAIPMFFLPAVYHFSEDDLKKQLRLLVWIAVVQLPIAVYQRYQVILQHRWTGDPVFGTMQISSILSIFLIGVICVAAAMMLRGRLTKLKFFWLFVICVIPTTINETKGTVLLLPLGLIATLLVGSPPRRRLRIAVSALTLVAVFGALYIPIYNYFASVNNPYPYTVEQFFSSKKYISHYLDKQSDLGSAGEVGRIDSLVVPLQTFASDPIKLVFGVGAGNASVSSLGQNYTGQYYGVLGRYGAMSSGATFIIEIGVLGLLLLMSLYWMILRDTFVVALYDSTIVGDIALGWLGFTLVIIVSTFYKSLQAFESLSYLFWYFSGLIVAQRMRLALEPRPLAAHPEPPLRPAPAPLVRPLHPTRPRTLASRPARSLRGSRDSG
jgi:hypothetical protein